LALNAIICSSAEKKHDGAHVRLSFLLASFPTRHRECEWNLCPLYPSESYGPAC
jgi:hypothetical protein